jgi:hypothetical protein
VGGSRFQFKLLSLLAFLATCCTAFAQPVPVLTWITNSSIKVEQIIGDVDWQSTNVPTVSQTATRFHILANGEGYSFEDNGKLIFLFGDTVSDNTQIWEYAASDPLAWSTNTDGEAGLLVNFFTNRPHIYTTNFTPVFVQPAGISMAGDDVPCAGISLSNGVFLVCTTGSDPTDTNNQGANGFSVLTTFYETNLLVATNTYAVTNYFVTNRIISSCTSNLPVKSLMQGHFIIVSLHEFGTNVVMFGAGEYRAGDVFMCMTPTANFVSGQGTLYFAGLTNNQPVWSNAESNCVPVVQDNPTNGPPWPNDAGTVGNVSVTYSTNLNLWLMTYDGGRSADSPKLHTTGIYFSSAPQPWGPWSTPQLIYNKFRDGGDGVYIYDARTHTGPAGPTIHPTDNIPTNTDGATFAPNMIERFTRITNSTLVVYYTMSTWNPYTVLKMRSWFTISPVIDPASLVKRKDRFSFSWSAPTNAAYQVDYSGALPAWSTFTNVITSTNGVFNFTDGVPGDGGLPSPRFYRLRTTP